MTTRNRDGEYLDIEWEFDPAFYAVRGHIEPAKAAEIVNRETGADFTADRFRHGWLKLRFSEFSYDGPTWMVAEEAERPNIRVTLVRL